MTGWSDEYVQMLDDCTRRERLASVRTDEWLAARLRENEMAWITFDEVAVKGVRRWTDADGKKRQMTKTFSQTLNPFNRNACGLPKTRTEIMEEITAERDAWLAANAGGKP